MKRAVSFLLVFALLFSIMPIALPAGRLELKAGNDPETGKVRLSWNAVSSAGKYAIFRSDSENGKYIRQYTTTKTSYVNKSALAGSRYYYKVKALDADGKVLCTSRTVRRVCDCARPSVTASNNEKTGKIRLTWDEIYGAKKYEIYRAEKKDGKFSKIHSTSNTSYTNTSAKAGYTYYYKVKAISDNSSADSAFSEVKKRTCDCAKMSVSVKWTHNGYQVFSWDTVSGATGYRVYRSGTKNGSYRLLADVKGSSYTDKSAKAGYYYYYKFVAVSSKSSAASSSPLTVKSAPAPKPVQNFRLVKEYDKYYQLSWDKSDGADGYMIFAGKDTASMTLYRTQNDSSNAKIYKNGQSSKPATHTNYFCIVAYCELSNRTVVMSEPSEKIALRAEIK